MKKETHKHTFEIKAWADGWGILCNNRGWFKIESVPIWFYGNNYVVNDAYVEFRKAEKEGKTIEIKRILDHWEKIEMSNIQPSDCIDATLRIKPEKNIIEFEKEDIIDAIVECDTGSIQYEYTLRVSEKMYNQIINKLK